MNFKLNGKAAEIRDEHPHLLAALREELGVTSPKDGCAPSGQCGCCLVLVDGRAVTSCTQSLASVEGKEIQTLEGLPAEELDRYARAFAAAGALQCGFCTPGIVMRTKALLDAKGDALERDEAARFLGTHLCRCTGYVKILDAIETLAKGEDVAVELPRGLGTSGIKYEGCELAVGRRPFIDDMKVPGMLHGALKLTDHARAEIVSIDATRALEEPGVENVFTAADVPGELRVGLIHKDWPVFIPIGGITSYLGDVLAIVVAKDRETARRAAELVDVTYRVMRTITDPVAAIDDSENAVWTLDGNVLSRSTYQRGDVEDALASSAHVVHETFQTQRIEHAFLEPESTLAIAAPGGVLQVYSGGQGIWDDRNQIASVLGVPQNAVRVELVSNGGAFGGKEDMANQAQTALAAYLLGKPVKCTLSREESLLMHPKRHPIRMEYWAGCDDDGKLTAVKARMIGDSGPYASVGMKVLERAAGHATGPYHVPAVDVEAIAVRTNNPVCGAFRGFGANQAHFAIDGALDRLAEQLGISGWEIRSRNVIEPGKVWGPGQIMDDGCLGARVCLDAVKPAYDEAVAAGKAVGVALGLKNSGLGNGFLEIAKAVILVAAHDVGRAVNPLLCEGQVEGAVHMGLGFALSEDFPADKNGRPKNMTIRSLGIVRAADMPEVDVKLIESPEPNSPYGIKGVGEIGLVPTAGAVAAALHDVDGTWRTSLPMARRRK